MGRAKKWKVEKLPGKLLQIRESLNLRQGEMISKLGLEGKLYQGNISEYESGLRQPPLPVILAYARLAKISTDILLDDRLDL